MKNSSLLLIAVSAIALCGFSVPAAMAQGGSTAAPATVPTPPTPPTFGAAVPGQCVLDVASAMSDSAIGKAANDRMVQLGAVVKSELAAQDTALSTEYKTLQASKAAATTAAAKTAFDTKAKAFEDKYNAFQALQQQRSQEMQYTQQEVMAWIFDQMVPQINKVVTTKGCATVINADSLLHYSQAPTSNGAQPADFYYANPSMNITTAVVSQLDSANIQLPQFDRADLTPKPGAGGQ